MKKLFLFIVIFSLLPYSLAIGQQEQAEEKPDQGIFSRRRNTTCRRQSEGGFRFHHRKGRRYLFEIHFR